MPQIVDSCGCVIPGCYDSDEEQEVITTPLPLQKNAITVNELIEYLQKIKEQNEEFGEYILHHVEFGGLTKSRMVEVDTENEILVVHSQG
jgi:hypothetical protein